jgi:hypothetical protein
MEHTGIAQGSTLEQTGSLDNWQGTTKCNRIRNNKTQPLSMSENRMGIPFQIEEQL